MYFVRPPCIYGLADKGRGGKLPLLPECDPSVFPETAIHVLWFSGLDFRRTQSPVQYTGVVRTKDLSSSLNR